MAGPLSAALKSGGGKDLLKELNKRLAPAVGKYSDFIAEKAEGSYVWTTDGQKHLDMACGIGVASTGHCHPKVVKAIQDQASDFIIAQQNVFTSSPAMVGLLDRLTRIVPKGLDTHVFANSGSEVVENAIKMARAHTKKTNIIAFDGCLTSCSLPRALPAVSLLLALLPSLKCMKVSLQALRVARMGVASWGVLQPMLPLMPSRRMACFKMQQPEEYSWSRGC